MKTYSAYIHTKARAEFIQRTLPSWAETEVDVHLVVEPQDAEDYEWSLINMGLDDRMSIRVIDKNDQGLAYVRDKIIGIARDDGHDGYIMSDDDLTVEPGISALAQFVEEHLTAAGAGFSHRLNLYWSGGLERGTGAYPVHGGTAQNCIGLSTKKLEGLGYDLRIRPYQDKDILLQLLQAGYGPWYLHTDAFGKMVGQRYQPGGNAAHDEASDITRAEREMRMYDLLRDKWGEDYFYLRKAPKALREKGVEKSVYFKWKPIYRDFNPEAYEELYG